MAQWKTYSQTIFGKSGRLFEGVEQGFDPCAEPNGRVQVSINVDYSAQTLKKRNGYEVVTSKNTSSIMSIKNIDFEDINGILILYSVGYVVMLTEV